MKTARVEVNGVSVYLDNWTPEEIVAFIKKATAQQPKVLPLEKTEKKEQVTTKAKKRNGYHFWKSSDVTKVLDICRGFGIEGNGVGRAVAAGLRGDTRRSKAANALFGYYVHRWLVSGETKGLSKKTIQTLVASGGVPGELSVRTNFLGSSLRRNLTAQEA